MSQGKLSPCFFDRRFQNVNGVRTQGSERLGVEARLSNVPNEELPKYGRKRKKVKLTRSQKRLAKRMQKRTQKAAEVRDAKDEEEHERLADEANRNNRTLFGNGTPGTGIKCWKRKGARILFALPTSQRVTHPRRVSEHRRGALLFHRPLSEAMGIPPQYDLDR